MRIFRELWPGLRRDIVLNSIYASALFPKPLRWRALRAYGMKIEPCNISPNVWFGSSRVTIGRGTFISYGCMFNTSAPVVIGRNCDIAMRVVFATSSHDVGAHTRRAGRPVAKSITVEDGCWIGAGSLILPGVTVGAGTIVAAGSVVTKDCEPDSLYAGVPARKVKDLADDDRVEVGSGSAH